MDKIDQLIAQMTVEEKVAQLVQIPYSHVGKEEAEKWVMRGIGSFLHVLGDDARHLQKLATENGHKIPLLFGIDAIHGHALNKHATVFPSQLSMACSFNPPLVEKVGRAAAEEITADGLHWTFSPVLCLGRDTRWGRIGETFGEDKYLAGELGAAIIKGYQGDDPKADGSVIACAKHFIGYGEATGARDSYDTEATYRKLRDTFLPPFERAVEAGCASFMTAYGSIDGTPCTADSKLLKDILKKQLKFTGFVVTDWQNVTHLKRDQRVAADDKEASMLAMLGGNDMMMNAPEFYEPMIAAVKAGEIDIKIVDDAVKRILRVKEKFGLFDNPFKGCPQEKIGCDEHIALAEETVRDSVVLLKNDGILPMNAKAKVCLIGDAADDIRVHYGDWTYFSHPLHNFDAEPIRPFVTLKEGLEAAAERHGGSLTYCPVPTTDFGEDEKGLKAAVKAAKKSDVIVFAFGDSHFLAGEAVDRADPSLTEAQQKVFAAISALKKPIVSVLIATKPLCMPSVDAASRAVVTCFNGGMFGGRALADVLYGDLNPSGRLPISFPQSVGQQPTYYNTLPGWHMQKYADAPAKPLYAFGQGLSYAHFTYSDIRFDPKTFTLVATVKNDSPVDGKEVVQVYFRDLVSSVMTPVKQLIAFQKIELKAGQSETIGLTLSPKDFSLVNAREQRVTEKGDFILYVGSSSCDEDLTEVPFSLDKDYKF